MLMHRCKIARKQSIIPKSKDGQISADFTLRTEAWEDV
jgi:hypothetical protein